MNESFDYDHEHRFAAHELVVPTKQPHCEPRHLLEDPSFYMVRNQEYLAMLPDSERTS